MQPNRTPLDQSAPAPTEDGGRLNDIEREDVEAGFELVANILLAEESVSALLQAYKGGGDPGAITGAFIGKMLLSVIPKLKEQGPEVSDRAWMAQDGIADRLIDEAGTLYTQMTGEKFSPEMHDTAFTEIMDMLKSAQGSGAQPGMEQPPQGGEAPPVPQMMQGGF